MASIKFSVGDDVYIGEIGETGHIKSLFPEINLALVKTDNDLVKAKITDLYKVVYDDNEEMAKRLNLLDRIRGVFKPHG